MNRRDFLTGGLVAASTMMLIGCRAFGASEHRYQLAPEAILPEGLRYASDEIREAYRFAAANRDSLRYIPCYCGCGEQGHTSNASCYVKDSSPPDKLEFDPMSVG
jgi:Protein of unknown function with PCYCGC motif